MANTAGEKELKTNWPIEEGLTARTTRQVGSRKLHPEEGSDVPIRRKELL